MKCINIDKNYYRMHLRFPFKKFSVHLVFGPVEKIEKALKKTRVNLLPADQGWCGVLKFTN